MSVLNLARPHLVGRTGYTSALGRFDMTRLHANELPELDDDSGLNRYPPPRPLAVTERLGELLGMQTGQLLLTRGSNEGIDLLVRGFCRESIDSIVVCPPTFGMYEVCADVQGANVQHVALNADYQLDVEAIVNTVTASKGTAKLVFLCSPANPTGSHMAENSIERLCTQLKDTALIVLDQAYIEFSPTAPVPDLLARFDNLVVLRTFSKAYGLAGLRCGLVAASEPVIALLDSLLAPYSTPTPTIDGMLRALSDAALARSQQRIELVLEQKQRLSDFLEASPLVTRRYPSDSNFLLIDSPHAKRLYEHVFARNILIRSFFSTPRLEHSLRVTVGNADENTRLMRAFEEFSHDA